MSPLLLGPENIVGWPGASVKAQAQLPGAARLGAEMLMSRSCRAVNMVHMQAEARSLLHHEPWCCSMWHHRLYITGCGLWLQWPGVWGHGNACRRVAAQASESRRCTMKVHGKDKEGRYPPMMNGKAVPRTARGSSS